MTQNLEDLLYSFPGVAVGVNEDQFREECEIFWNEYGESIDILALK